MVHYQIRSDSTNSNFSPERTGRTVSPTLNPLTYTRQSVNKRDEQTTITHVHVTILWHSTCHLEGESIRSVPARSKNERTDKIDRGERRNHSAHLLTSIHDTSLSLSLSLLLASPISPSSHFSSLVIVVNNSDGGVGVSARLS